MSAKAPKSAGQTAAEDDVEEVAGELGPFVVAADTTRMPMVFTDATAAGDPIVFVNDAYLKMTGFARDEVLGQKFDFAMAHDNDPDALAILTGNFGQLADQDPELCFLRKSGERYWATVLVNPVLDDDGVVVQHFASMVELTRHKEAQQRAQAMIDELNHRVKNTLATVQSIVTQGLRNVDDPATAREAIVARLNALSRSHDLLTRAHWEGAGLLDLVRNVLEPFSGGGKSERFVIQGDNLRVTPKVTLALGIALHELATNAVKYGAFSNDAGCIRIDWSIVPKPTDDRLVLNWRESGGPPVTPPTRKGFGMRVISQGLAHELEGVVKLDFDPDGVTFSIDLPAPRRP